MLSRAASDGRTHRLFNRARSSRSQTLTDNQTVRLSFQVLLRATPAPASPPFNLSTIAELPQAGTAGALAHPTCTEVTKANENELQECRP